MNNNYSAGGYNNNGGQYSAASVNRAPMPQSAMSRAMPPSSASAANRPPGSAVPSSARPRTGAPASASAAKQRPKTGAPVPPSVAHQPNARTEEDIVPQRQKVETQRIVRGAHPEFNDKFEYCDNEIKTSRYNVLTFLPLNLFEQFHRFANIYFLILVILQSIPLISPVNPVTTIIPFVVVLGLTAVKDLIDDIQRHKSDNQINNRDAHLIKPGGRKIEPTPWKRLRVGQVVQIRMNEPVPADMMILSTSDENGLCFIETLELDGETNLKVRQALMDTQKLKDEREKLALFDGLIKAEAPNNNLNRFEGRLEWLAQKYSLSNDNLLLRGCTLRNTLWVFGLVIFSGRDSKLMKNAGKTKMKRTRIDRIANKLILCILGFLGMLLIVTAVLCYIFETQIGVYFKQYSYWFPVANGQPAIIGMLTMLSYLILIQTLIPISLYVSVEFIRMFLSRVCINNDKEMYYEHVDVAACARTTTLNEELGQIEYIFSDKTGTLTQNIMTFNKCSINGKMFGDPRDKANRVIPITDENRKQFRVDFSNHEPNYFEAKFAFYDQSLVEEVKKGTKEVHDFWTLIALCHTIIADYDEDEKLVYKAQSPDEAALVGAARNFGFVYKSRTPNAITISVLGVEKTYELLCVLDFDNVRKRMSVIVQKDGRRVLMCKGADTLVLGLIDRRSRDLGEKTKAQLSEYAGTGLRTLVLATKEIDDDLWEVWSTKFHQASTSLVDREAKIAACYEEIEQGLTLLGVTAIEDKLQDGVPETIYNLAKAGIKLWVLTGDKQETAINIGYSCNMLTDSMEEFIIDAETPADVKQQLIKTSQQMEKIQAQLNQGTYFTQQSVAPPMSQLAPMNGNNLKPSSAPSRPQPMPLGLPSHFDGFALVINGPSLVHALHPKLEQLFLEVSCACKAVICCRVTPLQKALVVDMVKRNKNTVTLAIGDGANDVNMIKTAHIGVGISGQEGMQAVLASDFSFGQFRFLQRLLLVHGRWAYMRIAIFLRYFFYKNFAFSLGHFWFGIYCGWSALPVYDQWLIMCYNLVYTATPIIVFGWMEQDVNSYYSQTYPQLYQPGIRNAYFNLRLFVISCIEGVYTCAVSFFVMRYGLGDSMYYDGSNILSSQTPFGIATGTTIVVVVTIRCALEMSYWTVLNFVSIFVFSIAAVFVIQITFSELLAIFVYKLAVANLQFDQYGMVYVVWASPVFWLCFLAIVSACSIPIIVVRVFSQVVHTSLTDRVRALERTEKKKADDYTWTALKRGGSAIRRSRFGSGYAFSQQPGFGDMIQSGVLRESARMRGATGINRHTSGKKSARERPYFANMPTTQEDQQPVPQQQQQQQAPNGDGISKPVYFGNAGFQPDEGDIAARQLGDMHAGAAKPRPKRVSQQQYRMTFF